MTRTGELYYLAPTKLTSKAIAARLGVPQTTVRKRLYLFRRRLRAAVASRTGAG